jgi:NAD(P)-dependent dehydrogenase (short-subunit alcohol dehydrogenase family)
MSSKTKKVALVTGSSEGGIGFFMYALFKFNPTFPLTLYTGRCQELAKRDYIVYATSRSTSSTEGLTHPNIKRLALDVKDNTSVNKAVATAIEESGHIDLLINNAGLFALGARSSNNPGYDCSNFLYRTDS